MQDGDDFQVGDIENTHQVIGSLRGKVQAERKGDELCRAEHLEVSGYLAPAVRAATPKALARKYHTYNQQTGKDTGYVSGAEVLRGLAKIHELEHAVAEGVRPKEVLCQFCGKPVEVKNKRGPVSQTCHSYLGGCRRQRTCAGFGDTEGKCDKRPSADAFAARNVKMRGFEPWVCLLCAKRKIFTDPEYRAKHAEAMRKLAKDPEWRAKNAKAIREMHEDPEYRAKNAEAMRKMHADPEYRAKHAEVMRKMHADPEHRAKTVKAMRKVHADPEYRAKNAEAMRKMHADPEYRAKHAAAQAKRRAAEKAKKEASE